MHASLSAEGGWATYQISKRGGLTWSQFWEGVGAGCSFFTKNKLKSEIFNDKKLYKTKMLFSATTKNLNWEILTKNSVTFKRWDGVKVGKL